MMILVTLAFTLFLVSLSNARMSEEERVTEWKKKHTWPPKWQKESDGFRALMEQREKEIQEIPESGERWENWMQYVQGRYLPTFTELGFQIGEVPDHIFNKLHEITMNGLADWDNLRQEGAIPVIHGPDSKMIDAHRYLREVHHELLPLHEQWSGLKLKPTSIYGIRVYRNGSSLSMHQDKCYTHVISSILHIGHEYDNDDVPWPIEIEGHDGVLYQVNLQPKQMLFYESAKCLHGRRAMFRGKWYAGAFAHYQPTDRKVWSCSTDQIINAIPPHWSEGAISIPNAPVAGAAITTKSRRCENAPPLFGADLAATGQGQDEF